MSDAPVIDTTESVVDPNALAVVDPATIIEPPPAPEPPAAPAKKPWYLERISQESARAQEASTKLAAAERRAADAEALAERLRADAGQDRQQRQEPQQRPQEPDRQAEIRREAAAQRLAEDSMDVRNRGIAEYGASFVESLGILSAVGAVTDDFVSDVLAVDKANAHKIFDQIAKDPERAATLAAMSSRQRIAEITRMSVATAATKTEPAPPVAPPKTVSKAPAPPPKIDPGAVKIVDGYSDEASDEDFTRQFNERMAKRGARR
jgi:hypothetical protein